MGLLFTFLVCFQIFKNPGISSCRSAVLKNSMYTVLTLVTNANIAPHLCLLSNVADIQKSLP